MKFIPKKTALFYSNANHLNLHGEYRKIREDATQCNEQLYEVTVIVAMYNPDLKKAIKTIQSILFQKNVTVQIVVADDGSEVNYFSEIESFFESKKFENYVFVSSSQNQGIVKNVLNGVMASLGKYIKLISPGDFLYGKNILYDWVNEMERKKAVWSFSDAIFYTFDGTEMKAVKRKAMPIDIRPYAKGDLERCKWNYCVLDDMANGAAMLCERKIMLRYLKRIENKVIYAEDTIYHIMMFDGIVGNYFPRCSIFYEFGVGISAGKNSVWNERLFTDLKMARQEMVRCADSEDRFQREVIKALKKKELPNKIYRLQIKGMLHMYFKRRLFCRKTPGRLPE